MAAHEQVRNGDGAAAESTSAATDDDVLRWRELHAEEVRRIEYRRTWLKSVRPRAEPPDNHVGLALSGGGIRSATFSLGILRALSRLGLVEKVDYLSTVSGGGYAGSFYCSLFVPHPLRGAIPSDEEHVPEWMTKRAAELGGDPLGSNIGRRAIEQLREGGHFLNPNGTSDALFAGVVAIRNWFAVAAITGLLLLTLFLAANIPRIPDTVVLRNWGEWISPAAPLLSRDRGSAARSAARPAGASINCAADLLPGTGRMTARCAVSPPEPRPQSRAPPPGIGARWGASWLWVGAAALLPLWILPSAGAFWLTRTSNIPATPWKRLLSPSSFVALATAGVVAAVLSYDSQLTLFHWVVGKIVFFSAIGAVTIYALAEAWIGRSERGTSPASAQARAATLLAEEDRVRTKLSRWLYRGVFLAVALSAFALADDFGRAIYHVFVFPHLFPTISLAAGTLGGLLALIVPVARALLKRFEGSDLMTWPRLGALLRRFGRWIALFTGLLLLFAILSFWSALSYAIFWHGGAVSIAGEFKGWQGVPGPPWLAPVLITAFVAIVTVVLGRVHGFLNQTSLASFYAARLRKAYLGASNIERIAARAPADREFPTDEIELGAYYQDGILAPVHLINVTVNETTNESSRVIQRDRKGKGMTVSPAGYIFVKDAPSTTAQGFRLDQGEQLPVSTWMGISGAAFSTGMGQHSSLGLSLLAGLTNLRLGYWWNSPYPGRWREHRPAPGRGRRAWLQVKDFFGDLVQFYLLRELRDDHEGTHSNRWYLSDGGHFENTAVYELVRRRVPFIIACDNGADPTYEFSDFVNLVRKIRIDFDAETEPVSREELDRLFGSDTALRRVFGTLEDMVPREGEIEKGGSHAYAALVRVRYLRADPGGEATAVSTILLIKPRVVGDELPDLLRYKKTNVAFPQQPTTDLFFDEAQWESYYRLGQLITESIFAPYATPPPRRGARPTAPPLWHPMSLRPLAPAYPPNPESGRQR